MTNIISDIKYAFRQLCKGPGFTAIAVVSLALAIGAITSVFSLYNALMLNTLPVRNAERLCVLTWAGNINAHFSYCRVTGTPTGEMTGNVVSYPLYCTLKEQASGLADAFAFSEFGGFDPLTVIAGEETFTAHGMIVSGNFFDGLGLEAQIGRTILPEHDQPQAEQVTVISSAIWRRCFNRDPGVIGQRITLNKHHFTVIGVLDENFLGLSIGDRCDFYVPMSAQALVRANCPLTDANIWWVQVMARMSSGVGDEQLRASLETVLNQAVTDLSLSDSDKPVRAVIEDGSRGPLGSRQRIGKSLPILMGIVSIVLLAACANIASLLLARGASRQQEVAVRAALGAGSWCLIRQGLIESLLISLAGAAGGLLLATWGKKVLFNMLWPSQVIMDLNLDVIVLGFAIMICIGSALLFGLLPAWRYSRVNPIVSLKERSSNALSRMRLGKWMVSIQTALALLLLVGAGLFMRTLINLYQVETGFNTSNMLVFNLDSSKADMNDQQMTDFHEQVLSSIAALPGVSGVANSNLRLLNRYRSETTINLPNRSDRHHILILNISDSFLSTMGIPLLTGRNFSEIDHPGSEKVILINQKFAQSAFAGENPIGKILHIRGNDYSIVGVCGDTKYYDLKMPIESTVFFPNRQHIDSHLTYQVRAGFEPLSLVPAIRKLIANINPNIPMANIKTLEIQLDESIANERCFAFLAMSLALLAVLLSCIGLFGLMSYYTTQRTGEIGIRMALGAQPWDVGFSVMRSAILLVLIGAAIGIPLVLATSRFVRSYLFEIQHYDPISIVGALILLICVSLAAVWFPARRASKIDPMEALRYE